MITIFTDGSSLGNPGRGGWGAIVQQENSIQELGGAEPNTTNNRMEMKAIIEALRFIPDVSESVIFYTDSKYTIDGITKWVFSWQKNGWMTKNKTEVLNRDLWEQLVPLVAGKTIQWHHVAGHVGIPGNERVDTIAQGFASGANIQLYNGLSKDYVIDISHVEPQTKKVKSAGAKAFSYISLIDGNIKRYDSWADCEKDVKGKNAKFRKAVSSNHEKEIMKEWGVLGE